jgi:hypothetical protein
MLSAPRPSPPRPRSAARSRSPPPTAVQVHAIHHPADAEPARRDGLVEPQSTKPMSALAASATTSYAAVIECSGTRPSSRLSGAGIRPLVKRSTSRKSSCAAFWIGSRCREPQTAVRLVSQYSASTMSSNQLAMMSLPRMVPACRQSLSGGARPSTGSEACCCRPLSSVRAASAHGCVGPAGYCLRPCRGKWHRRRRVHQEDRRGRDPWPRAHRLTIRPSRAHCTIVSARFTIARPSSAVAGGSGVGEPWRFGSGQSRVSIATRGSML